MPLPIILPSSVTSLCCFGVLFGWYADIILVRCSPEPTSIQDHRPSLVGSVPVSMIKLDRREKVATIVPPGTQRLWFSFLLNPTEIRLPRLDEKICSGPLSPWASEWAKFVPCSTMHAPSVWCLSWSELSFLIFVCLLSNILRLLTFSHPNRIILSSLTCGTYPWPPTFNCSSSCLIVSSSFLWPS